MISDFQQVNSISGPIRVLHVDDEPADLEITRIFLKRQEKDDFEIVSLLSPEEALEKLEHEHFDVIIADYKMPVMNGIEFLEALRKSEKCADTPFILFTGKGKPEVEREALKKGADRYISKAGNPASQCSELAHAIRTLASRKRAIGNGQ
ncbi:MAG: response regulator [Methanophagales archaeon]|nr:response regulator [Methanophagales archaeon]